MLVATITWVAPEIALARSITHASIGFPRKSISTLPGSRVDPVRAWMITTTFSRATVAPGATQGMTNKQICRCLRTMASEHIAVVVMNEYRINALELCPLERLERCLVRCLNNPEHPLDTQVAREDARGKQQAER